jgi:hypothetical protein
LSALRFDAFEIKAGPQQAWDIFPWSVESQIERDEFQSYALTLEVKVGPAATALKLLNFLKLKGANPEFRLLSLPLARSPTAKSLTIDKTNPPLGTTANFTLDLEDTLYPLPVSLDYNVEEIRIWHVDDSATPSPTLIASVQPTPFRSQVTLPWQVDRVGGTVYAFAGTTFWPLTEIGLAKLDLDAEVGLTVYAVSSDRTELEALCGGEFAGGAVPCEVCYTGMPAGTLDLNRQPVPTNSCVTDRLEVRFARSQVCVGGELAPGSYSIGLRAESVPAGARSPTQATCVLTVPDDCSAQPFSCTSNSSLFFFGDQD